MEGRIFALLCTRIRELGKHHSFKGKQFSDAAIVITYLWAVLWDRPTSWACRQENWPKEYRAQSIPSPATMSRRLRTIGVITLVEQVQSALNELFSSGLCKLLDSKPLSVSVYSKDKDAKVGHGCGFPAKGYKLHTITDAISRQPQHWTLAPMNRHDSAIAADLIVRLPQNTTAYLVADNAYDTNPLYELSARKGCQLLAPKRPSSGGFGKHRQSPPRIAGHARLDNPLAVTGQTSSFGMSMLNCRIGVEQSFAYMGNIPAGLTGLPNWVRHPRRVALWIAMKLLIVTATRLLTKRVA
jgi:hypothetical protein